MIFQPLYKRLIDKLFCKHFNFCAWITISEGSFLLCVNFAGKRIANIFVKHLMQDKKVKNRWGINDKKFFFIYKADFWVFYNIINDMLSKAMSGRLWEIIPTPPLSAIAFRPKFFLSISNILKKLLGRLLYFLIRSFKFDGIRVHCRSSKLRMTPSLFFAKMQTSTFSPKSIPFSSELEILPSRVP